MNRFLSTILFVATSLSAAAQTGANRADASWRSFQTEHFRLIYHQGLEDVARHAAAIAETIYPVVTGNLGTDLPDRTPIYISDLDNVRNAFASGHNYIYLWMQGLQDDGALGGLRASGSAKWLRAVITHEFTHTVISYATRSWTDILLPGAHVPRWFHEGTARFMEPDRWTPDIDMVLRVAAVNGRLSYGDLNTRLDGALLYEGGHSLVRYMTARFGDTVIARILGGGRSGTSGFNFEQAVRQATGSSMSDIHGDWIRAITVYYGADYGSREETSDIAKSLVASFTFVTGYRYSRDASLVAMIAGNNTGPVRLYVAGCGPNGRLDSLRPLRMICDESGLDTWFDWSPDGRRIVLSKLRRGSRSAAVNDLYLLDIASEGLDRLTDNANLYDPSWRPDGSVIAAVQRKLGRDRIVLVDPSTGAIAPLHVPIGAEQIANLAWSPDGRHLAWSLFDSTGERVIAVLGIEEGTLRRHSDGAATVRYPVWSPDGRRIALTTHAGGVPNIAVISLDDTSIGRVTDVAGGVYTVGWLPGSDSIVAMSLDTRERLVPYLIPASRRVTPAPRPAVREKYTAWRDASFSLQVPPDSATRRATIDPEEGYASIAHISPMITLPSYGTDRSATGSAGHRLGLGSLLIEPIGLQSVILFADYGLSSKKPGAALVYQNNTLPFAITASAHRRASFVRELVGVPYHEISTGGALNLSMTLTPPNSLEGEQHIAIRGGWRRIEALNGAEFAAETIRPEREDLAEIGLDYIWRTPSLIVTGSVVRSEPELGSTVKYNRVQGALSWRWRLLGEEGMALAVDASGVAQWGGIVPQEFVGLDQHDDFAGGFDLFSQVARSLLSQQGPMRQRVRGVRRFIPGDRAGVGSIGLEFPGVPQDGTLLLFVEAGSAWFSDAVSIDRLQPVKGYGAEFRSSISDGFVICAGIAFEMVEGARRDLYLRLALGL